VPVAEAVRGFEALLSGEYDELPEQAFRMVATIEDVEKQADGAS